MRPGPSIYRLLPPLMVAATLLACGDKGDDDEEQLSDEVCDGRDNDGDGEIDEGFLATWWADNDKDGFGDPAVSTRACAQPTGHVDNDLDCDDDDELIFPGAEEVCDGADNDCDGLADDADADTTGTTAFHVDEDGDGYGAGPGFSFCEAPLGFVTTKGDCDDSNPDISPEGVEVCDGLGGDEDCDGLIDDEDELGDADRWYADRDADGFGDPASSVTTCTPDGGLIDNLLDCDDGDDDVNPDATEVCRNGVDDNCDGSSNGCLPVEGDEKLSNADTYISGSSSSFGNSISAGKVAGLSTNDLVVTDRNSSAIYVFSELQFGVSLTTNSAYATLVDTSRSSLGTFIEAGHDLTGDGQADLLAFASGEAVIWEGPFVGYLSSPAPDAVLLSDSSSTNTFGDYLATADFNDDGDPEVILADPYSNQILGFKGPLGGGEERTSGEADLLIEGDGTSYYFGHQVVVAGDMNGDGIPELLVTDYYGADDVGSYTGSASLFDGTSLGSISSSADADARLVGVTSSGNFGYAAAGGRDLDGDGATDILISAPVDTSVGYGAAFIWHGMPDSGTTGDADVTIYQAGTTSYFGYDVALPGDVDGDGVEDIAIGHLGHSALATNGGAWHLFLGGLSGKVDEGSADATIIGTSNSVYVGMGALDAADITGNGISDLVLSGYNSTGVGVWQGGGF